MEKMTLRDWRKQKGYTTDFVAKHLGIARETLTRKERNNEFSVFQIKLLCELFEINANQIV